MEKDLKKMEEEKKLSLMGLTVRTPFRTTSVCLRLRHVLMNLPAAGLCPTPPPELNDSPQAACRAAILSAGCS